MVLGLCFHKKCLMAQRNQFLQFESRILTGTEIKCLQLGREPLAFVYTLSTFMPILWAVNSCCRQIMSHYGLSSVNFQHTHPSRFTGGHGPCIRWVFNCLQNNRSTCQCRCRPWVGYCCPTSVQEKLILIIEGLQDAPITVVQIAWWTKCDPLMECRFPNAVLSYVTHDDW